MVDEDYDIDPRERCNKNQQTLQLNIARGGALMLQHHDSIKKWKKLILCGNILNYKPISFGLYGIAAIEENMFATIPIGEGDMYMLGDGWSRDVLKHGFKTPIDQISWVARVSTEGILYDIDGRKEGPCNLFYDEKVHLHNMRVIPRKKPTKSNQIVQSTLG